MSLTIANARNLIAKSVIGGANDTNIKADALDALTLALSDLNADHVFEFQLTSQSLTASADTRDYTISSNLLKVYDARWGSSHALKVASERIDNLVRPQKNSGIPTHYNMFPHGALTKMRLMPTPSTTEVGTLITLNYYQSVQVATATAMGVGVTAIDLPATFQYWPVYQGKAYFLSDRNAPPTRVDRWQRRADLMLARMKWMDQQQPDEILKFDPHSALGAGGDPSNPWPAVYDAYGY